MASSSSSSPSTPAFSSQQWKYHVYLSFRGEDTRTTFVDHLYTALEQKGIYTYKDDVTLPHGESIRSSLKKAIEDSQIAVIVFSENYAESTWCLDELEYIMRCKDTRGQIIVPIYYHVDPADVRKQKWTYGEAFAKHELENKKKVGSWRKALVDASNLSGWVTEQIANGHESQCIKVIVDTILDMLHPLTTSVDDSLVGVEKRMEELKSKLQFRSGGVRMIGIWGVGGGGKTTLAYSLYKEVSWKFDGCCFVENVREKSSNKNGLENLQAEILSGVLKQKGVSIQRVEKGRDMIMYRLQNRKVLIVLDDVDNLDQLKALAGSLDWFGAGSRIIITTRNQHLLTAHKVDVIHIIELLNDDEAIKLFCKHASRGHRRLEDYEQLSKKLVSYAGGLPLALTVLGCFLCDKEINEWEGTLARLKEIPDDDILGKLKISYDGLKPVEKRLFLDIAFFFKREKKDRAMEILDACGYYPVIGVKVLRQKALITISDGMFNMHDLVQEMAHHIVSHSRILNKEDVEKISAMDATTELDMIEAIRFKWQKDDPLQSLPPIVAKMKNLRWIDWEGDIASPLPADFSPKNLRSLKVDGVSLKQLWEGYKLLPNLRIMELYGLHNLTTTPDFDGLPNLERFKLAKCWYLEEIHPSIGRLKNLVLFSIESCFALETFPPTTGLQKLEILTFSRCPKLFKRSEIKSTGLDFRYRYLRKLDLSYCDLGDEDIGFGVWELPYLEELSLAGNKFSRLNFSLLQLPKLKWLNISYCKRLVELSELPSSIAVLIADDCTSLETFGDVSHCKWLWKVSHRRGNKLGNGDILLHSMLQGNAIEDHIISVTIEHHNPEGFVGRLFRGKTFTLHLPDDWYDDFCGFLICIVTNMKYPHVNIIIKKEVDVEDSRFEVWPEESVEPEYDGTTTSVGYVSFNSLRCTTLSTSLYNLISFSIDEEEKFHQGLLACESYVGAELIPRKHKGDEVQTRDDSEFCEDENTFTIQHDSNSSINILWQPCDRGFSQTRSHGYPNHLPVPSSRPRSFLLLKEE